MSNLLILYNIFYLVKNIIYMSSSRLQENLKKILSQIFFIVIIKSDGACKIMFSSYNY